MKTPTYEVYVGNVGMIYSGTKKYEADQQFNDAVARSKMSSGRMSGEQVTLMIDGEPNTEYTPEFRSFYIELPVEEWTVAERDHFAKARKAGVR